MTTAGLAYRRRDRSACRHRPRYGVTADALPARPPTQLRGHVSSQRHAAHPRVVPLERASPTEPPRRTTPHHTRARATTTQRAPAPVASAATPTSTPVRRCTVVSRPSPASRAIATYTQQR